MGNPERFRRVPESAEESPMTLNPLLLEFMRSRVHAAAEEMGTK